MVLMKPTKQGKSSLKKKSQKNDARGRRPAAKRRLKPLSSPSDVQTSGKRGPKDDRYIELKRDYDLLRGKAAVLEDRMTELTEAHQDLRRAYADLRERAGVIEQRYSELVERAEGAPPSSAPEKPSSEELAPPPPRRKSSSRR
jgi:hypothetical protein